ARGARQIGVTALLRRALRLARKSRVRGGRVAFLLEALQHRARAARRWLRVAPALRAVARGLLPGPPRAGLRGRQLDAGATRLRQADGDGLLGRPRAVLALADVVHLLADELAGLGRCRLALALVSPRSLDGFLLWHDSLLRERKATHVPGSVRASRVPRHVGYKGEVKAWSALLVAAIAGAGATPAGAATVRGSAFDDADGDGLFSAGEDGIAGVRIAWEGSFVAVTGADGSYSFDAPDEVGIAWARTP